MNMIVIVIFSYFIQKSHTGVHGAIGLLVVKHVEEVYPSERDIAIKLDVRILFIRIALEMIMNRRNVMTDVAQVRSVLTTICNL